MPAALGPQSGEGQAAATPHAPPPTDDSRVTPAPVTSLSPPPAEHRFRFHGTAEEFFRIWIVNTLLTLLTAGIFFSWAKVRRRRYLRGSTELMGHRFDYRADPRRLLVGHLLVAAFFVTYSLFGTVYPVLRWAALAVGVLVFPWVIVRSLAFNAHNTLYRGLRFRFQSSLTPATIVYLLYPLALGAAVWFAIKIHPSLAVLVVAVWYPLWNWAKRRFVVSGHRLGTAYFSCQPQARRFYTAYGFAGGILIAVGLLTALLLGFVVAAITKSGVEADSSSWFIMVPLLAIYGIGWWLARAYIYSRLFNHVWNHTRLDEHRFVATMAPDRWLSLQLVNLFAIVGSLGLLYPWAVVRSLQYAASCLAFVPAGDIDSLSRLEASAGSATGDTAAEFAGFDFGL